MSDIFNEVKKLGIEFDSHESDLYIPVNEQTTELVKKYFWNSEQKCLSAIVTTFHNQTSKEKELWYDLAFQFLPAWENKQWSKIDIKKDLEKMGFKIMKKKIYEMTKEELLEYLKKYSVDHKKNKRKIEDIMWAIRSIQIQERKDRGEDTWLSEAGYTGRNKNK